MTSSLYLFVYGSLKLGECNDFMLRHWVKSQVSAWTPGEMRLRPDHYPALFLSGYGKLGTTEYERDLQLIEAPFCEGSGRVKGELLELSQGVEALPILDEFEGFFPGRDSEYQRVALSVHSTDGDRVCWTYTGVGSPNLAWPVIESWPPAQNAPTPEPYEHGRG